MVNVPPNQDLTAGSGIINTPFLESIYHSFMDEAMIDLGRSVTLHLPPIKEQDVVTQSKPAAQQYNPFFSRVPVPAANTRNTGYKVTPRDVTYRAQIVVGPIKNENDLTGMGELNQNEARVTLVIEALQHINEAIAFSIEGRRYTKDGDPRPIGFSTRRYVIVKLRAIQEQEAPSPDITIG